MGAVQRVLSLRATGVLLIEKFQIEDGLLREATGFGAPQLFKVLPVVTQKLRIRAITLRRIVREGCNPIAQSNHGRTVRRKPKRARIGRVSSGGGEDRIRTCD